MSSPAASRPRLLVLDVDSTFIRQEVIELIAEHAGTRDEVAAVTERAMRGELDFAASLRARVATLKGLDAAVLDGVGTSVQLTPGARELVEGAHARGWRVGLVSGGFEEVVGPLAAELGIDRFRANRLAVSDGRLTGEVRGEIVDRAVKERSLRAFAAQFGIPMADTIAIGDGANDLDMIAAAGIGIAFGAKPIVRAAAPHTLDGSLAAVLGLVDRLDAGLATDGDAGLAADRGESLEAGRPDQAGRPT